jgi:hypothetical protein
MSLDARLKKLVLLWPAPVPKCATCQTRPAVVGVEPDEECPEFPAVCPECGRWQRSVICLVAENGAKLAEAI